MSANIAKKFLLQSPPGELNDVASGIKTLLGSSDVVDTIAPEVFREYNTSRCILAELPGSKDKVLITKVGEIDASQYLDPRRAQVVTFDHVKQAVTSTRAATAEETAPADAEPLRVALEKALDGYISTSYKPNGECAVFGKKDGGDVVLTACISSSQFNSKNFWNGAIFSEWTARISSGAESGAKVEGKVQARKPPINVHYFEEGNVQLSTTHACSLEVAGAADADKLAAAIVAALKKEEVEFHSELEENFDTMSSSTFKELRRALPMNRQKFPWEQVQHKLAMELVAKEKAAAAGKA